MLPLTVCEQGKKYKIARVDGKEEVRAFLENLGFVCGSEVEIVNEMAGNLIVNIKDSRVGVDRTMAAKIKVL